MDRLEDDVTLTVPVAEEIAHIEKRKIEMGRVRVRKEINEVTEDVDCPLRRTSWAVTRVPKNEVIEATPEPRVHGDTYILPVVEEQWVLVKRLVLTEEIHIRSEQAEEHQSVPVTLRKENVIVERENLDTGDFDRDRVVLSNAGEQVAPT